MEQLTTCATHNAKIQLTRNGYDCRFCKFMKEKKKNWPYKESPKKVDLYIANNYQLT